MKDFLLETPFRVNCSYGSYFYYQEIQSGKLRGKKYIKEKTEKNFLYKTVPNLQK